MNESRKIIEEAKKLIGQKLENFRKSNKDKLKTHEALMRCLKVSSANYSRWLNGRNLPTMKSIVELSENIKFSEEEMGLIKKAIAAQSSLRGFQGSITRYECTASGKKFSVKDSSVRGKATPVEKIDNIEERIRRLEAEVFSSKRDESLSVSAEDYFSGKKDAGVTKNGVRFILTSDTFRKIRSGGWKPDEMRDTKNLVMELRRRLNILAQDEDDDKRLQHAQELALELDELWRAYQAARGVIPFKVLEMIESEREMSFHIRKNPEKQKE